MVHEQAVAYSRELRIVVSSASVMHQFTLAGLDTELLFYPSFSRAIRPGPATLAGRLTWDSPLRAASKLA
jgi:hypothetical protein